MAPAERERWAETMRRRIERQVRRARPSDQELERRAVALNRQYFGRRLRWNSVAYARQGQRWGSCTFTAGVVRVSDRARRLPSFVRDYILVHELAHLEHDDHGAAFWEAVDAYPLAERARGYLLALDHLADAEPELM
jgi:predicted metal-dependent hydrolase